MNITRKTWVSAGVVGVILVGGVSVTAAASAGRVGADTGPGAGRLPAAPETTGRPAASPAAPRATSEPPQGAVVSRDLNPEPGHVARYWTEQRMREAKPLPMPAVDGPVKVND